MYIHMLDNWKNKINIFVLLLMIKYRILTYEIKYSMMVVTNMRIIAWKICRRRNR